MTKRKKKQIYFTQDTEDAIVEYNNNDNPSERSEIYRKRIHYAFFKLTENIIHTFKFYHTEVDEIEHLQHEIITFLLSKIHLFDPSKGAKAYSYFGTIVKRYLIYNNTKNYKKKIENIDIDSFKLDEDNDNYVPNELESYQYDIEDQNFSEGNHVDKLSFFIDGFVDYCTANLENHFPKEIVDIETSQITKISKELYSKFKKSYSYYIDTGITKFY